MGDIDGEVESGRFTRVKSSPIQHVYFTNNTYLSLVLSTSIYVLQQY